MRLSSLLCCSPILLCSRLLPLTRPDRGFLSLSAPSPPLAPVLPSSPRSKIISRYFPPSSVFPLFPVSMISFSLLIQIISCPLRPCSSFSLLLPPPYHVEIENFFPFVLFSLASLLPSLPFPRPGRGFLLLVARSHRGTFPPFPYFRSSPYHGAFISPYLNPVVSPRPCSSLQPYQVEIKNFFPFLLFLLASRLSSASLPAQIKNFFHVLSPPHVPLPSSPLTKTRSRTSSPSCPSLMLLYMVPSSPITQGRSRLSPPCYPSPALGFLTFLSPRPDRRLLPLRVITPRSFASLLSLTKARLRLSLSIRVWVIVFCIHIRIHPNIAFGRIRIRI